MADKKTYYHGTGKRKSAIANVRLFTSGGGKTIVNGQPIGEYLFGTLVENALSPLKVIGKAKEMDLEIRVVGGGKSAQSDAIRLGISRALLVVDPGLRSELKHAGFLRRDSRIKERKKPGLHGARRAPQFAKR